MILQELMNVPLALVEMKANVLTCGEDMNVRALRQLLESTVNEVKYPNACNFNLLNL